jgi:folate-binding protein YgfZ
VIATSDYELLTGEVGRVDRAERTKLLVGGGDGAEFLQGQLTNDVEGLTSGTGCYAALLTHKGKLRADMRVLRGEDWIWLDSEPQSRELLLQTLERYSLGRDVRLDDVTDERAITSLIGPRAREALDTTPPDEEHAFVHGELGLYVATDLGVDVISDVSEAERIRDAIGAEPVSAEAAECLRIESGRPRFGLDMDEETIPEEAGLNDRAVSFTKGCYVGQETVARLHYKGRPNRHLRGLRLSAPADRGDEVRLGERAIGRVGSSCVSPAHGPIALAVIRREAGPGAQVAVGDRGAPAEVLALPFT